MISALLIDDPERVAVPWWPKVAALKKRKRIDFAPGLTVLWGPNGCGKSTVLRVLARLTHCEQGGIPLVSEESLHLLSTGFGRDAGILDGARIIGDGRPVHFLDPTAEAGLMGGGAAFDYDFLEDGLNSMFLRSTSSGQQITAKLNRILKSAAELKKVPWKFPRKLEGEQQERADQRTSALRPSKGIKKGLPTLLLDEPDRSISIPRQAELWDLLSRQPMFQIIVATHSPFALSLGDHVQYLDLQEGYLAECLAHSCVLGRRAEKHLPKAEK